jgi:L,D-transpeptidase catalytic domain
MRMKRRNLLKEGLAAGALVATPLRAFGQSLGVNFGENAGDPLGEVFDRTFAQPSTNTPYEQRLAVAARRERDRAGTKLWRTDRVGIADFARPSSLPRLHFVDMESGKVRSFLVAHGRGSDHEHDGWLKTFSNQPGSEATSRGAYLTCEWYMGKYGTSIRLEGMSADNSHALDRAIVMHPAWYVDLAMADKFGKIGRSEGCFAMSPVDFNEALWHLSGGRLLFADRIGEA